MSSTDGLQSDVEAFGAAMALLAQHVRELSDVPADIAGDPWEAEPPTQAAVPGPPAAPVTPGSRGRGLAIMAVAVGAALVAWMYSSAAPATEPARQFPAAAPVTAPATAPGPTPSIAAAGASPPASTPPETVTAAAEPARVPAVSPAAAVGRLPAAPASDRPRSAAVTDEATPAAVSSAPIATTAPAPPSPAPAARLPAGISPGRTAIAASVQDDLLDGDRRWFAAYYAGDSGLAGVTSDRFQIVDLRSPADRVRPGTPGVVRRLERTAVDAEGEALILTARMVEETPATGQRVLSELSEVWVTRGKAWELLGVRIRPAADGADPR